MAFLSFGKGDIEVLLELGDEVERPRDVFGRAFFRVGQVDEKLAARPFHSGDQMS